MAADSVFQVTTGSGVTPGICRQIGKPSDLYTIAYMSPPEPPYSNRCCGAATRRPRRNSLLRGPLRKAFNVDGYWGSFYTFTFFDSLGSRFSAPSPKGASNGKRISMSNMRDAAVGLCMAYGKSKSQYETQFEPATGTLWGYFNPRGTACFSLGLLKDIRAHDDALAASSGCVDIGGQSYKADYYVAASRVPRVFNLGGDLALFVLLIKSRDRDALAHYARMCIDNMHARIQNYFTPTSTLSLVQGDALGGLRGRSPRTDRGGKRQLGGAPRSFSPFPGRGAVLGGRSRAHRLARRRGGSSLRLLPAASCTRWASRGW